MGGFLGIGTSAEERALQEQNRLKQEEAERARREAEIRLAEKKAQKGQEIANVKLGTSEQAVLPEQQTKTRTTVSNSLGLGATTANNNKTGIQI